MSALGRGGRLLKRRSLDHRLFPSLDFQRMFAVLVLAVAAASTPLSASAGIDVSPLD